MKVYFDNGATTPLHPKVVEAMLPFMEENFGNPSSIHQFGRKVKVELENARENIANFINADPGEIYFTSGGTEAINFIVRGITKVEYLESSRNNIITSAIEHHAVLETCESLEHSGFDTTFLLPDKLGIINPVDIEESINADTSLLAFMHVNNELGSVNPIKDIARLANSKKVFLFADCVQSMGKIKIDVKELGINAMSASAHKIYGPKGAGFAYVKSGTPLASLLHGGSQERNRRGGTENVIGIIGLNEAVNIAREEMSDNYNHALSLRKIFREGILKIDDKGISINGDETNSPYLNSISFNSDYYNIDGESMLIFLDINGIAVSNGSACNSGTVKASHVMKGIGKSIKDAEGTLRISFGRQNKTEEVEYFLEVMERLVRNIKK